MTYPRSTKAGEGLQPSEALQPSEGSQPSEALQTGQALQTDQAPQASAAPPATDALRRKAAQTAAAPRARFYRPELDLLRFAAFLLVFLFHCLPEHSALDPAFTQRDALSLFRLSAGDGLCLFFLLSSFLITELLLRERERTGTVHLGAFYVRRVLRIWPLYFAFVAFGYAMGRFVPFVRLPAPYIARYLLLLGNWAFYMKTTPNPIGPLWSISVEEQFYLCWPTVARRFGRRGLLLLSCALIPAALLATALLAVYARRPGFAIWTNTFTQFECFALGALLALALHDRPWSPGAPARLGLLLAGAGSWLASEGLFHFKRDEYLHRGVAVQVLGFQLILLGCCAVFLAVFGTTPPRWSRPLVYLGRISYGLYVFHILGRYLAMRAVSLAHGHLSGYADRYTVPFLLLALAITTGLAAASYRFFEKPFLVLKERFTFVESRAA